MPSLLVKAGAWCNGEVAYLAWQVQKSIPGCLGFMITRIHETGTDAGARRILPSWIAFTDQSNPNWLEQDTSVWPVQNFEWRDLTLRRSRDTTNVRPIDFRVHYEIVPVGLPGAGRTPLPSSATAPYKDGNGHPRYVGTPRPLYQIGDPAVTDPIDVTHRYSGPDSAIEATFTNGILSTQNLLQQLQSLRLKAASGTIVPMPTSTSGLLKILKDEIAKPSSPLRAFLTADTLSFVRRLVDRAIAGNGEVYLALYELHDPELIDLLVEAAKKSRIHLILSTAGNTDPNSPKTPKEDRKPVVWDTENNDARARLHAAGGAKILDRMFNNKVPIGHDKFAVYVENNVPQSVMTGSTNWTETGLCTQSNNAIILHDKDIAKFYFDFWQRLKDDPQPNRVPYTVRPPGKDPIVGAEPNKAIQGATLRKSNMRPLGPATLSDRSSQVEVWYSPNTASGNKSKDSPMPGDLNDVYTLMDHAREAILFLTFMPGESGQQNIIGEAAKLATARPELLVLGAISDPSAMPNYVRPVHGAPKTPKPKVKTSPTVWWPAGNQSRIVMVNATAISTPMGDLHPELLSAGHAIIHDKIIVIDPLDPKGCAVITGSHNLGYKASYDNDENLLIIRGNRDLAVAYAVHVLDVYQHYLMRAKQEDRIRSAALAGTPPPTNPVNQGFLNTQDAWQARFFQPEPATARQYFLGIKAKLTSAPGDAAGLGSRTPATEPGSAPSPVRRKKSVKQGRSTRKRTVRRAARLR